MGAGSTPWYRTRAGRSWLVWGAGAIVVAAAITGYILAVLAGEDGRNRIRFLVIGGLCSAVPVLTSTVSQTRGELARRRAEEIQARAEAKLIVTLGAALSPALHYLGKIAAARNKSEKRQLAGLLVQAVVDAASGICGPDQTRSIFFRQDGKVMECEAYAGRAEPSTTVFTDAATDPAGQSAFEIVRRQEAALYEDIHDSAPPGLTRSRSYRTFIAAAVLAGDESYGMLTVDAPEPGVLTDEDLEVMKVLANLLGAGLALSPPP